MACANEGEVVMNKSLAMLPGAVLVRTRAGYLAGEPGR